MRVAWVQIPGATLDSVPFRPYPHDCYWGPASYTESSSNTLKSSERSAIPRPRLVCSHGFMSSEKRFEYEASRPQKPKVNPREAVDA